MKIKRFFAPDMRQAMRAVREEVGPDAVIVSNNRVAGGVELIVALDYEPIADPRDIERNERKERQLKAFSTQRRDPKLDREKSLARKKIALAASSDEESTPYLSAVKDRQIKHQDEYRTEGSRAAQPAVQPRRAPAFNIPERQPRPPALYERDGPAVEDSRPVRPAPAMERRVEPQPTAPDGGSLDPVIQSMQDEIRGLRSLLEQQMQAKPPAPAEPVRASLQPRAAKSSDVAQKLLRRFDRIGLSVSLARRLVDLVASEANLESAWRAALIRLSDGLPVMGEDFTERGGIVAFVGSSGVGKTTTIGKLAARYVLRHGSSGIALVTTDSYRIAAHEQLRTFGRILDIPVRIVDEHHSLDEALQSLRDKRLVLIDTSGLNAEDASMGQQMQMLNESQFRIKKQLVLSSTSQYGLLKSSYDSYSALGLNGCVLTKLDEPGRLGDVISIVVENRLPVSFVSDGQKVPDNLELAKSHVLVSRAVVNAQKLLGKAQENKRNAASMRTGSQQIA